MCIFIQKDDAVLTYNRQINYEKCSKLLMNKNAIDSLIQIAIIEIKKSSEKESPTMCFDLEKYYSKVFQKNEKFKQEEKEKVLKIICYKELPKDFTEKI